METRCVVHVGTTMQMMNSGYAVMCASDGSMVSASGSHLLGPSTSSSTNAQDAATKGLEHETIDKYYCRCIRIGKPFWDATINGALHAQVRLLGFRRNLINFSFGMLLLITVVPLCQNSFVMSDILCPKLHC